MKKTMEKHFCLLTQNHILTSEEQRHRNAWNIKTFHVEMLLGLCFKYFYKQLNANSIKFTKSGKTKQKNWKQINCFVNNTKYEIPFNKSTALTRYVYIKNQSDKQNSRLYWYVKVCQFVLTKKYSLWTELEREWIYVTSTVYQPNFSLAVE